MCNVSGGMSRNGERTYLTRHERARTGRASDRLSLDMYHVNEERGCLQAERHLHI